MMLFAEEPPNPEGAVQSVNFWLTIGLLVAVLLGGAVVLAVTERWRKRQAKTTREGIDGLSLYREMYEDGELDEEEYRVIRDRFARELKGLPPAVKAGPEGKGSVGEASGANRDGSPVPPPEPPAKAPPIS